jgi:hypothetical protein
MRPLLLACAACSLFAADAVRSLPIVNGRPHERGLSIEQQTAAVDDVLRESVRYFLQPSSSDILLG